MAWKTVLGTRRKWRTMPAKESNTGYSKRESSALLYPLTHKSTRSWNRGKAGGGEGIVVIIPGSQRGSQGCPATPPVTAMLLVLPFEMQRGPDQN